jgi:NAD(P)-dependent dehydrogenase (short-subunit alcohol dehydrogenase family)
MKNKSVAIVTGAGGGIGRAICTRLASSGWSLVVADLNEDAGNQTAMQCSEIGIEAIFRRTDVTDSAEMRDLVAFTLEHFGAVDGFVNNAGIEGVFATFADYPEDIFDDVMRINSRSVFLGLKHALPVLLNAGAGAIVNIASTSAIRGRNNLCAYVASKHAVLGLTRVAALEADGTGVRVNAVLPGPIATRMTVALDEMVNAAQSAGTVTASLGRAGKAPYGEPADVAGIVAFLLSDEARHVNGAAWTVDAGSTVS